MSILSNERKTLKKKARQKIKTNYWAVVSVCFFIAIATNVYSNSTFAIKAYSEKMVSNIRVVEDNKIDNTKDVIADFYKILKEKASNVTAKEFRNSAIVVVGAAEVLTSVISISLSSTTRFMINGLKISTTLIGETTSDIAMIILGILLTILFIVYISNVLTVGEKRFFLENEQNKETKFMKVFFVFHYKHVLHVANIMFFVSLYLILWSFTLFMLPIKIYEYSMIPFIVAENPQISKKDAFKLSKQMMQGNKWDSFILDISFIGWHILTILTLGLFGIFYNNGYHAATWTELYLYLRGNVIETPIDLFNENKYKNNSIKKVNCIRNYSFVNLILLFFSFSIIGWVWEVFIHLVEDEKFVNRGVLFGPWLPIYGSGGVVLLLVIKRFLKNPIKVFAISLVSCSIIEYVTSWYLELTKGYRWWDYSGYYFNINGRICLLGAVIFGLGGCAISYILAPRLDNLYIKINKKIRVAICVILILFFVLDLFYSSSNPNVGHGITDYEKECINICNQICRR